MTATTERMARKSAKQSEPEQPDRLPSVQVRIPGEIAAALEDIAREEWTTLPTQLILAAKLYLRHKGRPVPER